MAEWELKLRGGTGGVVELSIVKDAVLSRQSTVVRIEMFILLL